MSRITKAVLFVNPRAGGGSAGEKTRELVRALNADWARGVEVQVWPCTGADDLRELIERARDEGFERVLAAGGDGSVHALVNALSSAKALDAFSVGIIPLGTGNDLSRTLGIPLVPLEALKLALTAEERAMDLIRVRVSGGPEAICANHASVGMSTRIEDEVDPGLKARWKSLAYVRAAGSVAMRDDLAFEVTLTLDGRKLPPIRAVNVVVGNGQTAGGGFRVAPDADPHDSWMDVVVTRATSRLELAGAGAKLLSGDYTESDSVDSFRAREVEARCEPAMGFSVDGELFPEGATRFAILPRALRVVAPLSEARGETKSEAKRDAKAS